MIDEIKKQLPEYEIVPITRQTFERIFEVYATNQDFFLLVNGINATIENSISDIDAIPPDTSVEQKIFIGIWEAGKVIGVLDLILGYPEQTSVWIGLLLIHGKLHNKKIGSRIVNAVLDAAGTAGYQSVQLGVIESNTKGMAFWQKHGFDALRYDENIVVMAKHTI